jgi:hypothetical protein
VQLGLEVMDVALSSNQLILSVLQSGVGVVEVIGLEVMIAISPHQLIIQLPDARLQADVLLQKLLVALLDVLHDAVLGLHQTGALLQAEAQVSARHCDLLKQGAHVLGVKCPTRMVGWKLGVVDGGHTLTPHHIALVPNGEQGNDGVTENRQVMLTELCEGLVGSPFQSVIEVVTPSHGKPSHHGRVGRVSRNVHVDLAAPQPELTVWAAAIRGKPHVTKAMQHIPEQGRKPGAVQPVATEPSVGSKCGVGVVIHLSETREKRINILSIEQRQQIKTPK